MNTAISQNDAQQELGVIDRQAARLIDRLQSDIPESEQAQIRADLAALGSRRTEFENKA